MAEPVIRRYHAQDLEAMVALDQQCFSPPFQFSRRAMAGFAGHKNALTRIALSNTSVLAGFIVAQTERTAEGLAGYVITLDVAPCFRGTGLAARLMREAETLARERGATAMRLHAHVENRGAIRFYERMGYERAGDARDFYAPGVDAIHYKKPLRA